MVVQIEIDVMEMVLTDWLANATTRPIGLGDLPEKQPHIPYAVITPLIMPRGYGTEADPECIRDYVFQVLSIGKTPRQARWMAEMVRRSLIGRDAAGARLFVEPYLRDTSPTSTTVGEGATLLSGSIQSDSLGPLIRDPDGQLFQIPDTYRMKVE